MLGWGLGVLASPAVQWRWEPAAQCPDPATVEALGDALLGASPTHTAREPARASLRVEGRPGDYTLALEVQVAGHHERRRLRAGDCELLARAGVMVVAITVDALATAEALPSTPPTDESLPPTAAPPPDATISSPPAAMTRDRPNAEPLPLSSSSPQPPPSPRRSTAVHLGASTGLGFGLTASGTTGFEAIVGGQLGALRIEAAGYHWLTRPTTLSADTGTESALSGGWIHGCYAWSWTSVDLPLCFGADLAAMHGRGIGSRVSAQSVLDLWIALSAGPGLWFRPTPRLAVFARAEPLLAVRRPAMFLLVDGQPQETFRMPAAGFRVLVGGFFVGRSRKTRGGGAR